MDPDETPRSAAFHLGVHCLVRPVCPNIYGKYSINDIKRKSKQVTTSITCYKSTKSKKVPAEPGYTLTLQTV